MRLWRLLRSGRFSCTASSLKQVKATFRVQLLVGQIRAFPAGRDPWRSPYPTLGRKARPAAGRRRPCRSFKLDPQVLRRRVGVLHQRVIGPAGQMRERRGAPAGAPVRTVRDRSKARRRRRAAEGKRYDIRAVVGKPAQALHNCFWRVGAEREVEVRTIAQRVRRTQDQPRFRSRKRR